MSIFQRLMVSLLPLFLMGCAYFATPATLQNRDKQIQSARSIPPLKIPPGISSNSFQSYYPVSNKYYPGQDKSVNLTPPGL